MDSLNQRIHIPIHHGSNNFNYNSKDTTVQWINDPNSGNEKYRMRINIEGFNQNEVIGFVFFSIARLFFVFGNQ
jgi:hypothetical protein